MSVATNIFSIGIVLMLALVFTMLAFNWKRILKVGAYAIGMVFWFVLTPLYFTMFVDTSFYFLGWIFLLPGVFCMLLTGNTIYDTYKHVTMEDWEKDESWEEE